MTTLGKVEVEEWVLRRGRRGKVVRSFCQGAAVQCRGYSMALERAVVDFGAEESFERSVQRMWEHYRLEIGASAVAKITLRHARGLAQMEVTERKQCDGVIITQMDGSMVPMVKFDESKKGDRRKARQTEWKEVRLCLAREKGGRTPIYGATMGGVLESGLLWKQLAEKIGPIEKNFIHGQGDGAVWITDQFQIQFADRGRYLLDFYHVSEYLGAAAPADVPGWLHEQQSKLKNNLAEEVLMDLSRRRGKTPKEDCPIGKAYEYLNKRSRYLDYPSAIANDLPIGSGEIESGHRHVIQERLKIAGAWWKPSNANLMLGLRTARANQLWESYWKSPALLN